MKSTAFLLTTLLWGQTDTDRLAGLNRQADTHFAAYNLDKTEPLLEQALDLAIRLGPDHEALAQTRLVDLYMELQKRDGQDWLNLAFPHILRAIDLSRKLPPKIGNQLVARLALAVIHLPRGSVIPEISPQIAKFLDRWITELEAAEGPLNPASALSYVALSYAANGSEGQLRALNACDILRASNQAPAEFATLMLRCAELESIGLSETNAVQLAHLARKAATAGGPPYAYEIVLSYIIESEAENSVFNPLGARSAAYSAEVAARKALSPEHPLWRRIRALRGSPVQSKEQRELIPRFTSERPTSARIQPAKVLTQTPPPYTKEARAKKFEGTAQVAVVIRPDGKGIFINTFNQLPYGLYPNVEKAIPEWTFQPWTKDGKPVAGASIVEVKFQLKN